MKYQTPFYTKQSIWKQIKSDEDIANSVIKSKALKKDSRFLVLEIDNKIEWFIYWTLDSADTELYDSLDYIIWELNHIFVSDKFRWKWFSKILRDNLFEWFKEKGVWLIEIWVNQDNPAYNIYKSWWFESKFCYVSKDLE